MKMSSELVFYTHPMSRGRIVRWMLEEMGAPYETSIMNYAEGGGSDDLLADGVRPDGSIKSEAYLRINPMGKVPAIRPGNTVVTEAAAGFPLQMSMSDRILTGA